MWRPKSYFDPRAGWVVGFRVVREGELKKGHAYSGYDGDYDYEPGHLTVSNTVQVVLVSFWPSMKPVLIPLNGYVLGGTPISPQHLAYQEFAITSPKQEQDFRQMMREEAEKMERDEHGRFKKIGRAT